MQVALGLDRQVEQAVAGERGQHVVEEADAGGNFRLSRPVEGQGQGDVGFRGFPRQACRAGHGWGLSLLTGKGPHAEHGGNTEIICWRVAEIVCDWYTIARAAWKRSTPGLLAMPMTCIGTTIGLSGSRIRACRTSSAAALGGAVPPERVILIEPQEAHDGQAGDADGFAYTMLYLPRVWLLAALGRETDQAVGFQATLLDDARLGAAIRSAFAALTTTGPRLERDAALDAVVACLTRLLGQRIREVTRGQDATMAQRARERLLDMMDDDVSADELAIAAGAADRFHLARAFRGAYGVAPHAWLVQMRLMRAREMLARGMRPAAVAAECGFADQSHLGRWFRRAYGITPAAYRACCTGVPDLEAAVG